MHKPKKLKVIIAIIIFTLFVVRLEYTVYKGEVVRLVSLDKKIWREISFKSTKYKDVYYSYVLIQNQDIIRKITKNPNLVEPNKYDFLVIRINNFTWPAIDKLCRYKNYRVFWRLNRLCVKMYDEPIGTKDSAFGILIPKDNAKIVEYIKKGYKVFVIF